MNNSPEHTDNESEIGSFSDTASHVDINGLEADNIIMENDTIQADWVYFRPLIDFLKDHIDYLPTGIPYTDYDCPICLDHHSESRERFIQIDLPACHHIFGADCFEIHIQHSHTCPMCRTVWFEERVGSESSVENLAVFIGIPENMTEESGRALGRLLSQDGVGEFEFEDFIRSITQARNIEIGDSVELVPQEVDGEEEAEAQDEVMSGDIEGTGMSRDRDESSDEEGQPPRRRRRLE
ncbi:hypothetical protein P280DRAFT_541202 [Massarina eburnea CBS 473.64]|uniref:RING-type domain-containing protein n=1 Tax=Massarina eburnea CBS 473.64 TaxID=1395130 RepID=A0A6A6S2M0_9PLEO|nr:hypothetical protein P280DRAFT_541202 [Massarina eburnea CBS 473.64]